jgi:hypothetical protein
LANQNICIQSTITDPAGTTYYYSETFNTTTNQFGLFTLELGRGTPVIGTFSAITWKTISPWLKIEMKINCTGSYVLMGTSELLSVPYAFYAESGAYLPGTGINISSDTISLTNTGVIPSQYGDNTLVPVFNVDAQGRITNVVNTSIIGLLPAGTAGQTLRNSNFNWVANSLLYNNGTNIGIGTTAPAQKLDVAGTIRTTAIENDQVNDLSINSTSNIGLSTNTLERMRITSAGDVGIGTGTPGAKLEVAGQVKITGGSPAAGKVLTADASGLASWEYPVNTVLSGFTGSSFTITDDCSIRYIPASVTITVPAAGYITVESNTRVTLSHSNGTSDRMLLSIGDGAAGFCSAPEQDKVVWSIPAAVPTAAFENTFMVRRVFTISAAGTYTYYLDGEMATGGTGADVMTNCSMQATYTR